MTKSSTEEKALRAARELARVQEKQARRDAREERAADKARAQKPTEEHVRAAAEVLKLLTALRERKELFVRGRDVEVSLYRKQSFFDSCNLLNLNPDGQVRYVVAGSMGFQAWPINSPEALAQRVSLDDLRMLSANDGEGIWKRIEDGITAWLRVGR